MPVAIKENNYQDNLRVGLIGSCTNSSYEDKENILQNKHWKKA